MTTSREPERITASLGTRTASFPGFALNTTVANIPGFRRASGFLSSMRARTVRVAAVTSGRMAPTRPSKVIPG
jgi:hypothetical protein